MEIRRIQKNKILWIAVFMLVGFGRTSFAEDESLNNALIEPSPKLTIKWFKPALNKAVKPGFSRITLTGQSMPGATISFGSESLAVLRKNQVVQFNVKDFDLESKSVQVQSDGNFEWTMDLPVGNVQLPIQVEKAGSETSRYQLNMLISRQKIVLDGNESLKVSPLHSNKLNFWFGTGLNYLNYKQTTSTIPSTLNFGKFNLPSFYLQAVYRPTDEWRWNGAYSYAPGALKSTEEFQIADENFAWKIATLESVYYPKSWSEMPLKIGFLSGVQHHSFPFLSFATITPKSASIQNFSLMAAQIGFLAEYKPLPRWNFEAFLAYQYPFSKPAELNLRPDMMFNGSIGGFFKYSPALYFGLFSYGQYHKYAFEHDNQSLGSAVSGNQSIIYSNLEFRIGFEY